MDKFGERTIIIDCDVDGGRRRNAHRLDYGRVRGSGASLAETSASANSWAPTS